MVNTYWVTYEHVDGKYRNKMQVTASNISGAYRKFIAWRESNMDEEVDVVKIVVEGEV